MFCINKKYMKTKLTVSLGPTIVATHLKRLSPSGKADTDESHDI